MTQIVCILMQTDKPQEEILTPYNLIACLAASSPTIQVLSWGNPNIVFESREFGKPTVQILV